MSTFEKRPLHTLELDQDVEIALLIEPWTRHGEKDTAFDVRLTKQTTSSSSSSVSSQ